MFFIVVCCVPTAPLGLRCTGFWRFLYTFRPSGAIRGWCALRTLQMYFSNRL